jgi:hypothetical protein
VHQVLYDYPGGIMLGMTQCARLQKRALVVVLAAGAVTVSASARTAYAVAVTRYPKVYVANRDCRGHTIRPANITLACADANLYATEVSFFRQGANVYGSPEADASATIHENRCKPDCAAGSFFVDKGALVLKRIVRCSDGLLYYSRAEYAFVEGQNEVDIQPFEHCSVVRHGS